MGVSWECNGNWDVEVNTNVFDGSEDSLIEYKILKFINNKHSIKIKLCHRIHYKIFMNYDSSYSALKVSQ